MDRYQQTQLDWDANLNLPEDVSQLYNRRYSDPGGKRRNASTAMEKTRPRRFSLSTFHDLKDISSGKIRSCVGKVLQATGFTAFSEAKSNQMRRYSLHIDPKVQNNLGADRKSSSPSFLSRAISCESNAQSDTTATNLTTNNDGTCTSKLLRKRSLTSYAPCCYDDGHYDLTSARLDSHNKHKNYPTRDNSRNSQTANAVQYCDPRKIKLLGEYESPPVPKCRYKLRDNELIASELMSSFGVQIDDSSTCCGSKGVSKCFVGEPDRSNSKTTFHNDVTNINSSLCEERPTTREKSSYKRKGSASTIRPSSSSTSSFSRSRLSFAEIPKSPSPTPANLTLTDTTGHHRYRNISESDTPHSGKNHVKMNDNNKSCKHVPMHNNVHGTGINIRKTSSHSREMLSRINKRPESEASQPLREPISAPNQCLRKATPPALVRRHSSQLSFEFIGAQNIHGSPHCSGRLHLYSFRGQEGPK